VKGLKGEEKVTRKCKELIEKFSVDGKPCCFLFGHPCVGPEYCDWYSPEPHIKDRKEDEDGEKMHTLK
jgi:hypothetical protein